LNEGGGVVRTAPEIWLALDIKPEDALISQFGGVSLESFRVLGNLDGTVKAN
jgi:hypothetical protein